MHFEETKKFLAIHATVFPAYDRLNRIFNILCDEEPSERIRQQIDENQHAFAKLLRIKKHAEDAL